MFNYINIKDYKLSEIKDICDKYRKEQPWGGKSCGDCPFYVDFCDDQENWCSMTIRDDFRYYTPDEWIIEDEQS